MCSACGHIKLLITITLTFSDMDHETLITYIHDGYIYIYIHYYVVITHICGFQQKVRSPFSRHGRSHHGRRFRSSEGSACTCWAGSPPSGSPPSASGPAASPAAAVPAGSPRSPGTCNAPPPVYINSIHKINKRDSARNG